MTGGCNGRPGVWGTEVPQWGPGAEQKLKQNAKLVRKFYRFPVDILGFSEHRSRYWTVYFANAQFQKILKIQWGGGIEPLYSPLWVRQCAIATITFIALYTTSDVRPRADLAVPTFSCLSHNVSRQKFPR